MVRLVVFIWLGVAFVVGATGALATVAHPTAGDCGRADDRGAARHPRLSPAREPASSNVGPGPFVLFHLVRIAAGAYFLVLGARGVLPREFTTPAGWGDILVGIGAMWVLMRCLPVRTAWQRVALLVWNVAGLLDILGVLGNAVRLYAEDPVVRRSRSCRCRWRFCRRSSCRS